GHAVSGILGRGDDVAAARAAGAIPDDNATHAPQPDPRRCSIGLPLAFVVGAQPDDPAVCWRGSWRERLDGRLCPAHYRHGGRGGGVGCVWLLVGADGWPHGWRAGRDADDGPGVTLALCRWRGWRWAAARHECRQYRADDWRGVAAWPLLR